MSRVQRSIQIKPHMKLVVCDEVPQRFWYELTEPFLLSSDMKIMKLNMLPCSVGSSNATTPSVCMSLLTSRRTAVCWGLAPTTNIGDIQTRKWIFYLAHGFCAMHEHPPDGPPRLRHWGVRLSVEWLSVWTLEIRLQVHQWHSGWKMWYPTTLLWEFR